MDTPRTLKILLLPLTTALTLGGLSGCVNDMDSSLDTRSPAEETATVTATEEAPGAVPEPATTITPEETLVDTPPAQCTTNPMASDFAPFLEQSRIPAGELGDTPDSVNPVADVFYHFQIGENGYDSCAELSYVVLNGSNGNAAGSAGTGSSIADAVVLFHQGEMITNPAPFEMKTVEEVSRISDAEIKVHYGHAGGATAAGVTEEHTFSFSYGGEGLTGAGSLPENIDQHLRLYLL